MARFSFERTEVLLYDPLTSSRDMGRAALYNLGFRLIEGVATFDGFVSALRRRPKDLVLCEARGAEIQISQTIQSLRRDAAAYNPFVVIIVTAWEKTSGLVNTILNSGADDLLLRPLSTGRLGQHIEAHIESRKPFVVTTDYVGPDRRAASRENSTVEPFVPPNSLKVSVTETAAYESAKRGFNAELNNARRKLNSEKLCCDAFQMCVLWKLMHENLTDSSTYSDAVGRIASLAKTMEDRLDAPGFESALGMCRSVPSILKELDSCNERTSYSTLLGQSLFALLQTIHPCVNEAEQRNRVELSIIAIKKRRRLELRRAPFVQSIGNTDYLAASAS